MNQSFSGSPAGDGGRSSQDASGERFTTDSRILEKVLQETVSAAEAELPAGADWQTLLDVARRHPGQPFSQDPVLVEMVEALLRLRSGHLRLTAEDRQAMVRRIAGTLFDDQPSLARLENLWQRLCEASQ
jgi:hypothetical protein